MSVELALVLFATGFAAGSWAVAVWIVNRAEKDVKLERDRADLRVAGVQGWAQAELSKAFNRIQDPPAAVADSFTQTGPLPQSKRYGESTEKSMAEAQREKLEDQAREVERMLKARGIDPSELEAGSVEPPLP